MNGSKTKANRYYLGAATFLCDVACKFAIKKYTSRQNGHTIDDDGVRRERGCGLVRDPVYPMVAMRAMCDSMRLGVEVLRRGEANQLLKMRLKCECDNPKTRVTLFCTVFTHFKTVPDMYFKFFSNTLDNL